MAGTPAKQRAVALVETPRSRAWDFEDDIYSHLKRKNRVLESGTENFNYFSTLLQQEFVAPNPKGKPADQEIVQFMDGLYSIVQSQQLHVQDQNRNDTAEENGTEEENDNDSLIEDPQYVSNEANVGLNTEMMHVPANYKGKRRGRKPKGPKHHGTNPNGSGNHVASETQEHAGNHRGRRRGRKPKGGPKLHAEKNPNGNSNHVTLEAQKYAGKRAKNHAVPMTVNEKGVSAVKSACFGQTEGQTIDHGTKVNHSDTPSGIATTVKEEIEDYDDDCAPHIRRPVQDPVLNAEHFWHDDEANARTLTKFREKLMEELKMPYCQEEYERLLKDITVRKPVQRQKVLRGRIKIYEEDYDGKSLLDHHIDLAKKIDSARGDLPRVLNLLRGFFYWLMLDFDFFPVSRPLLPH